MQKNVSVASLATVNVSHWTSVLLHYSRRGYLKLARIWSLYPSCFRIYWALIVFWSRVWPFGVTWRDVIAWSHDWLGFPI